MTPILVINPRSDGRFVQEVQSLAEGGIDSPSEMQRFLRDRYPRAVVRERELDGEQRRTWYVYREGTWVPSET
jgi:hypothetical protein